MKKGVSHCGKGAWAIAITVTKREGECLQQGYTFCGTGEETFFINPRGRELPYDGGTQVFSASRLRVKRFTPQMPFIGGDGGVLLSLSKKAKLCLKLKQGKR